MNNLTIQQKNDIINRILNEGFNPNTGQYEYETNPDALLDPTTAGEAANYWRYACYTAYAILAAYGVRIAYKALGKYAIGKGMTRGQALRWLIKEGLSDWLAKKALGNAGLDKFVNNMEGKMEKLENTISNKSDEQVLKITGGLSKSSLRQIVDELGNVDIAYLAKSMANEAKMNYFADEIDLDKCLMILGLNSNKYRQMVARTWLPIFKKAYIGEMRFITIGSTFNPTTFGQWFKLNKSWLYPLYEDFNSVKSLNSHRLSILKGKGDISKMPAENKQILDQLVNKISNEIQSLFRKYPISDEILALANRTGKWPGYTGWKAVQRIVGKEESYAEYKKQRLCYLADKHGH